MESTRSSQLSFAVISAASDGNVQATAQVLKHYESYISKCCLKALYDEHGMIRVATDTELKGLIHSALLNMIHKFEVTIK